MKRTGFSLLEVMVALAILGLTLSALFAAEVGAFKAGHSAHRMTEGTLLARCKMAEIEADLNENGFQLDLEEEENEPCCADEESEIFSCSWRIEPLELENLEADETGAGNNPLGDLLGGGDDDESSPADALTGSGDIEDVLSGNGPVSGGDLVGGIATGFVWPLIAPSLSAQVRRVSVHVHWGDDEGFDVAQYVVLDPGNIPVPTGQPAAPAATTTATAGNPNSGGN